MNVGIVYDSGSPLYCRVRKDGYWVINGEWKLGLDGKIQGSNPSHRIDYEIIIEDMPNMHYQEACEEIRRVYKEKE